MIDLVLHNGTRSRTYGDRFFRRICDAAAPYFKAPKGHAVEIGISLIGITRMRALNKRYRGMDKSTDVLSFPLSTASIKGYTAISLGDLFISPSDVVAKAAAGDTKVSAQMTWTVVHGLLHLAGYDHEKSSAAAKKMFALESLILKKLNYVLPLHHLRHRYR